MKVKIGEFSIEAKDRVSLSGVARTHISIIRTYENGDTEFLPYIAPFKVSTSDNIFDGRTKYTRKELKDILENYLKTL